MSDDENPSEPAAAPAPDASFVAARTPVRDILDLSEEMRRVVGECEVTGRRTMFQRNGRNVAVLVSWDEYLALRETIAIINDPEVRERLNQAEEQITRGEILLPEDLFES